MIATAFFWTVMVVWIVLYLGFLSMECDTSLKSHKKMTVKKFIIELIIFFTVPVLMIWLKDNHEGVLFWVGGIVFFIIWPLVKALKDWNNSNR